MTPSPVFRLRLLLHLVVLLPALAPVASALDNGLGLTPQRGWSSWNAVGCNVNSSYIRGVADAMHALRLHEYGYQYINVDDCWASGRDANGSVVADPVAFPEGMAALAAYVHSRGFLFGIYSDAGNKTCAGRPGSLGYEAEDARSYSRWGVDYLKYDNCNAPASDPPQRRYAAMRDALNATGRPIFYSLCDWGVDDPSEWGYATGNSARTTHDVSDKWGSVYGNVAAQDKWASFARPGFWNDPDMLEVGNGGLTPAEERSHVSLWAAAKAPLIIGCDVSAGMSARVLSLLTNTEVLAVSADPLGAQATRLTPEAPQGAEVWGGPLRGGGAVAVLLNRAGAAADVRLSLPLLGVLPGAGAGTVEVRDLWQQEDLGAFPANGTVTARLVPSHGSVMLLVRPSAE